MDRIGSRAATPYLTNVNHGVADFKNKLYSGSTGLGAYNLDAAYGLTNARTSEPERLAQDTNCEFYRNCDANPKRT